MPYKIKWKSFTSGPPLLEALNAGAIDVGGVGNTPPLFAAAANSKLVVVSGATMGAKGDTIVVPKGSKIKNVADLKGKKVAVAEGSSANYDLLAQLDKAGAPSRTSTSSLPPAGRRAGGVQAGHVDAWAIWDPYTSQAELDANARVIVDGGGLVNGMVFQAANPDRSTTRRRARRSKDYLARIAEATGVEQHPPRRVGARSGPRRPGS